MVNELKKEKLQDEDNSFPAGPGDKDSKKKETKGNQEMDLSEELNDTICPLGLQLKHVPDWAPRNIKHKSADSFKRADSFV
jgi:hypothetical protein